MKYIFFSLFEEHSMKILVTETTYLAILQRNLKNFLRCSKKYNITQNWSKKPNKIFKKGVCESALNYILT